MRKKVYQYLVDQFKSNKKIALLLGDIGVFSFKSAFDYDSSRIYNMGILEQSMIGVAGGMADQGLIPFVHSIAPFVTERCFEQLKLDLGYESRNVFVISVGASYDYAALGVTHHCSNDLNIVSSIPNFKVFCPGNFYDFQTIINGNLDGQFPKYIRLSEAENNLQGNYKDLEILQSSPNGLVIVVGNSILDFDNFIESNINATVLYTFNISEFDYDKLNFIIENNKIHKKIVVIEPCNKTNIIENICLRTKNIEEIHSISVPQIFIDKYGTKDTIDNYLNLGDANIISRLKKIFN